MIIVKLTNGNVILKDGSGNVVKRFVADSFIQWTSPTTVDVYANSDKITTLVTTEITGTEIEPAAVVPFAGNAYDLLDLLADSFFFRVTGGSGSQDLTQVLTVGNSAGTYDIDVNNNDLLDVNTITAIGDLTLNPVGAINCNGKTIDMTGGEIHKVPLIHSQNNIDLVIEGKGTADVILKTNNVDRINITDAGVTSFNSGVLTGVSTINGVSVNKMINLATASPNTAHTGTTNNTLVYSKLIDANVVGTGDTIQFSTKFTKPTGSAANPTVRIYVNTSASLSGATLLATYATTNLNGRFFLVERTANVDGATTNFVAAASGALTDSATLSVNAPSDISIDWTVAQYIIVAIQLGNAADSTTLRMVNVILNKAV